MNLQDTSIGNTTLALTRHYFSGNQGPKKAGGGKAESSSELELVSVISPEDIPVHVKMKLDQPTGGALLWLLCLTQHACVFFQFVFRL